MRTFVALSVVATAGVLAPATARAHFTLDQLDDQKPVSWISQDSVGGPQKTGPCAATVSSGDTGTATPSHIVTGLMAGETVKITVTATIAHPGWYRIALMEGPSASQSLTTIPDPMAMSGTTCTPAIMTNPVWSKTQPVIADGLPAGSTAKTSQSGTKVLTATIPQTANCTTASPCTLQVIMVMTDHPASDCYYHHCADITTGGSPSTDGGSPPDAAVDAHDGGMSMGGGTAAGGAKGSGGTTGTGSGGVTASGGSSATGGASASGGATVSSSGGATTTSSGGSSSSGGATASGGSSSSSGGATASGGKIGTTGSGGAVGSGGSSSSSGGATASSGGATGQGGGSSSGGCSAVPGAGSAPFFAASASILALLVSRTRRNRRR